MQNCRVSVALVTLVLLGLPLAAAETSEGTMTASGNCIGAPRGCGGQAAHFLFRSPPAFLYASLPPLGCGFGAPTVQLAQYPPPHLYSLAVAAGRREKVGKCQRVWPARTPAWTYSGVVSAEGDTFLLVDSLEAQVVRYSAAGDFLGMLPEATRDFNRAYVPNAIVRTESGFALSFEGRPDLMVLDQAYRVLGKKSLRARHSDKNFVDGTFQWALSKGNDLVTCSDFQQNDRWQSGILRIPDKNPAQFQVFLASNFRNAEWLFCRLGFPYIANLGDTAYVYLLNEQPGIYAIGHGAAAEPKFLAQLDKKLRLRPSLPSFSTPYEFAHTMQAVEIATMVTGLFAWENSLYLVHREPVGPSLEETRWSLYKVDPTTGAVLASTVLPTTTNHIVVIPGPKSWLVVEKGPVVDFLGQQKVKSFLIVPAELLRGDTSSKLCS